MKTDLPDTTTSEAPKPLAKLPTDGPPRRVVRASAEYSEYNLEKPRLEDIHLDINGEDLQTLEALTSAISEKLSLPAFTTRTPESFVSALDRRLFVMAKTEGYLQLNLIGSKAVPESVMSSLLQWVSTMPLRLLVIGEHSEDGSSAELIRRLEIELVDVPAEKESTAEPAEVLRPENDMAEQRSTYDVFFQPESESKVAKESTVIESDFEDKPVLDDAIQTEEVYLAEQVTESQQPRRSYWLAGAALLALPLAWLIFAGGPEATTPTTKVTKQAVIDTPTIELKEPEVIAEIVKDQAEAIPVPEPTEPKVDPIVVENTGELANAVVEPKPPVKETKVSPADSEYTIQLASYLSAELRDKYLASQPGSDLSLRAAETKSGGKVKSLVVYGSYPDYAAASNAIKELPEALQKWQPFPVKRSGLKF